MANKRPFDSLSSDFEKAATRQRAAYGEVSRSLDAVIAELEKSRVELQGLQERGAQEPQSSSSKDVVKSLGERVKALKCPEAIVKENRDYHAVLSKLGKAVDKHFISDMSPVLKGIPSAERPLLHRSVAMHFLHRGQFRALERFSEELASNSWENGISECPENPSDSVIPPDTRAAFEELHRITGSLEAHDVSPALDWLDVLPEAEQKRHSELSFELKSLRFTQLLSGEDGSSPAVAAAAALRYGRQELAQYLSTARGRDVAKLIGAVAFAGGEPKNSPYASLADNARWGEASRSIRRAYCEGAASANSMHSSPLPSPPPSPPQSPAIPPVSPAGPGRALALGTPDSAFAPHQSRAGHNQGASSDAEPIDRSQITASLFPVPRELPPFPLIWRYPVSSAFGQPPQPRRDSSLESRAQSSRGNLSQQPDPLNPSVAGLAQPPGRTNRQWLEPQASAAVGGRVRGSAAPRATFSSPTTRGSGSSIGGGASTSGSSAGGRARHPREHRATEERIRAMLMAQLLRRQASGQPQQPDPEAAASLAAQTVARASEGTGETSQSRYLFSAMEPLRIAQRPAGIQQRVYTHHGIRAASPTVPPAEGDEGAEPQEASEPVLQQAWLSQLSVPSQTADPGTGENTAEGEDTAMSPADAEENPNDASEETPTSFAPPPRVPSSESPQRTSETEATEERTTMVGEETQTTVTNGTTAPQETDANGEKQDIVAVRARVALPQHSLLSVTLSAGLRALPRLIHFFQMVKTSAAQGGGAGNTLLGQSHLPVEIDLGPGFHFHTTFTCAVSRSQTSRGNPPMLLACGHCISKQCLDRLARVARGRTVKCPICPQHQDPQAAKRLWF